ncbi:protein FANTASTIC FOUR 4-like isoform X2 [Arachis ipaensis]|uniref:protein FANTASTIC FOUR 4-like isoform X2 n=1 Tax=Arachis ipaensis TaxID=130454 RepID=UPI000A2B44DE|nr:protein FANTASTIC FOUR 4-like isoform X2 [Arachis ipaensis]
MFSSNLMTLEPISPTFLFFFYLSLLLLLPITMINTFLKNKNIRLKLQQHHHQSPRLDLLTLPKHDEQPKKPPNVVESAMLMNHHHYSSPSTAIGFDDDGMTSCTESLGFESSNERCFICDHQQEQEWIHDENHDADVSDWRRNNMDRKESRRGRNSKVSRSFPPPLTSLNRNGQPSFFLRPVRKDGRLELTQVRIQRQEILHACRQDGRLILHLIPDRTLFEEEQEQAAYDAAYNDEDEDEDEYKYEHEQEVIIANGKDDQRSRYGNELRRCHEMVNMNVNMNMNHHHDHRHQHLQLCGISIV